DLTGQHHAIGGGQGLAGHARLGVLGQEQVDDGVRDAVRDLVGVSLGNAFRGEMEGGTGQGANSAWPWTPRMGRQTYKDMLICSSGLVGRAAGARSAPAPPT